MGGKHMKNNKIALIHNIMIYVVFTLLMIISLSRKVNLHLDETYSYGLSNNTTGIEISVKDGEVYRPADGAHMDYMTVDTRGGVFI
jgi:hypothetical protein